MSGVGDDDGGSWLRLYGRVPVIYDEWRQEPPSLRVGVTADGRVEVQTWDGKGDEPAVSEDFDCGCSGTVTLAVSSIGDTFRVEADGRRLGTVQDPGVFAEGTVWFGLEADAGGDERRGGWRLTQLTARPESGDALRVVEAPQLRQAQSDDSLRARAADVGRPFDVGTALAENPLLTDSRYRALAGSQFSMLTPENAFKPQFLHPRRGVYDFRDADLLVRFARANHMKVHAHTLVWHEALPQWMREDDDPEEVRRTMLQHIATVAGHFKGEVAEWDVVNEPMSDDPKSYTDGDLGLRSEQSPWFEAMGEEYIDEAFRAAHRADPKARLFLNEYGVEEEGERWDALYALVERLKERGVPIDGVGFQTMSTNPATASTPKPSAAMCGIWRNSGSRRGCRRWTSPWARTRRTGGRPRPMRWRASCGSAWRSRTARRSPPGASPTGTVPPPTPGSILRARPIPCRGTRPCGRSRRTSACSRPSTRGEDRARPARRGRPGPRPRVQRGRRGSWTCR